MKRPLMIGVLVVAGTTAWMNPARADILHCGGNPVKWPTSNMSMGTCPGWSASDVQDITDAAAPWTLMTDSTLSISVAPDSNCAYSNAQNEIWWDSNGHSNSYTAIAVMRYWHPVGNFNCPSPPCCFQAFPNGPSEPAQIVESDIIIYKKYGPNGTPIPWALGKPSGQTTDPDHNGRWFMVTVQHELGHALGIQHITNTAMARMSTFQPHGGWFYSGTNRVAPLARDRGDAYALWPGASTSVLYMANLQTVGSSTCDSNGWCGFNSRTLEYEPVDDLDEFYPNNTTALRGGSTRNAWLGDEMEMRLCRGNLGSNPTAATTVKIYASPGDRIWQPTDVLIDAVTVPALAARTAGCQTIEFSVPANTPLGFNYILYGNGTDKHQLAVQPRPIQVFLPSP